MYRMRRHDVCGSISVFLALTITLMLSFCIVLIESARENAMLLKADMVFDTGMRCLMAEYHQKLWEEYDLFYVDCSYGSSIPDYEKVKSQLQSYIEENLKYDSKGWFALEYQGCQMSEVLLATDTGCSDFYRQAVEAAEASVGIPYIEQALSWLDQVESTRYVSDWIESDSNHTEETIEGVNGTIVEVKEAVWGVDKNGKSVLLEDAEYETVDISNPLDQILSGNTLLKQIVGEFSDVSLNRIDVSALASSRNLAVGTDNDEEDTDGIWEKAFFCKYVLDHFDNFMDRNSSQEDGLVYPLEYLIGGKAADAQNMEVVAAKLLIIREIDNYLMLLQDEVKRAEADAIGAAAASLVPWVGPVVAQGVLIYWAYEESVADLQKLFKGEAIPLIKSVGEEVFSEILLKYEDYIYLLLLMQGRDDLIIRAMDMIEADIRKEQSSFRIDACISYAVFSGTFMDIYDKKYAITNKIQYYQ